MAAAADWPAEKHNRPMHRLRKKHSQHLNTPPADAGKLLREQSMRSGLAAGGVACCTMMALWVALGMVFDRYFPWFSVPLGYVVGQAVQRRGHGIEWPFPVAAAALTGAGAFIGAFLVALYLTGREFSTPALSLVDEISWHTLSVFTTRNFGVDGVIYMVFAALLAAFYAPRRLNRQEAVAIRRWREARGRPWRKQ